VIVGGHRNTRVTRCVMSIGTVQGESSSPIRSPASRPCIPYACRIHPRPAVAVRAGDHGGAPRTDHTLWDRRRVSLPRSHLPRRPRPRPTPRAPSRTPTRRCQRATDRSSAATTAASARVCGRACGLSNAGTASDEGAAQRRFVQCHDRLDPIDTPFNQQIRSSGHLIGPPMLRWGGPRGAKPTASCRRQTPHQ
jgi:hypothetical protein